MGDFNLEKNKKMLTRSVLKSVKRTNVAALGKCLSQDQIKETEAAKDFYSYDESPHPINFKPAVITIPKTTEDVVNIVKWCNEYNHSIIGYGTGSGLEGGVIPQNDKTCTIDLSQMQNVISVNDGDQTCVVESGANASLGGMAASSASGTTAVRYGTMKENVLN